MKRLISITKMLLLTFLLTFIGMQALPAQESQANVQTEQVQGDQAVNDAIEASEDAVKQWEEVKDDLSGKVTNKEEFDLRLMGIMAILVYLFGLLGKWIPFFNSIPETAKRVTALAIAVGLGYIGIFYQFEMSLIEVLSMVGGYLLSYFFISPVAEAKFGIKTPKTKAQIVAIEHKKAAA